MGDTIARYVNHVRDPNARRALQGLLDLAQVAGSGNAVIYDAMTASQRAVASVNKVTYDAMAASAKAVASINKVYIDHIFASWKAKFDIHRHRCSSIGIGATLKKFTSLPTSYATGAAANASAVATLKAATALSKALKVTAFVKTTATTAWGDIV